MYDAFPSITVNGHWFVAQFRSKFKVALRLTTCSLSNVAHISLRSKVKVNVCNGRRKRNVLTKSAQSSRADDAHKAIERRSNKTLC